MHLSQECRSALSSNKCKYITHLSQGRSAPDSRGCKEDESPRWSSQLFSKTKPFQVSRWYSWLGQEINDKTFSRFPAWERTSRAGQVCSAGYLANSNSKTSMITYPAVQFNPIFRWHFLMNMIHFNFDKKMVLGAISNRWYKKLSGKQPERDILPEQGTRKQPQWWCEYYWKSKYIIANDIQ